jgi:hypothetical protein
LDLRYDIIRIIWGRARGAAAGPSHSVARRRRAHSRTSRPIPPAWRLRWASRETLALGRPWAPGSVPGPSPAPVRQSFTVNHVSTDSMVSSQEQSRVPGHTGAIRLYLRPSRCTQLQLPTPLCFDGPLPRSFAPTRHRQRGQRRPLPPAAPAAPREYTNTVTDVRPQ